MGRVIADDTAVRGGAPAAGVRAYGVCLQDAGAGDGSAGCGLSVDASWLDATGTDGGVGCTSGSLSSARFVTPAGGAMAPLVVIEPQGATAPAGARRPVARASRPAVPVLPLGSPVPGPRRIPR